MALALMLLAASPAQHSNASVALPAVQSNASVGYTEKLNVFIAGSSAYWYFTFAGINGSSKLKAFENSPGLSWYNVTAIDTTGWVSDFQIFGPEGYNLLPVPFIPQQGLFLTIGSDSYADALTAAGRLDSYFMAAFVSLANESSSFEFYSPLSFTEIVPSTLLELVPSSMGGFAAAISPTKFEKTLSPFISLVGTEGSSGFSHTLIVGSISNKALTAKDEPNLLAYPGSTLKSLSAANKSVSSTIQIRALDGIISSNDKAVVTNDYSKFTGSYSLTLAAKEKVFGTNATVLQQPLQLLAYRNVDVGVLQQGTNMSVSISLTNLSNSTALDNVTYSDNWWNPSLFKLVLGDASYFSPVINVSQTVIRTYKLVYTGNMTGRVTIPSTEVKFAYKFGGFTFNGHAWLNPITISLETDNAVVYAYVVPLGKFSQPVGATHELSLFVKNVGTRTTLSVVADGKQIGSLLADGGTKNVTISQTSDGLLGTNLTEAYPVTYMDVQGNQLSTTTNVLPLDFSHSGMELGFAKVSIAESLLPLKAGSTAVNLTLTFTVTNNGSANFTPFVARGVLPKGLGCGTVKGTGISCASDLLTLNYTTLATKASDVTTMKNILTDADDIFVPPLSFYGLTAGTNLTGKTDALALPTGYILTKQFNPSLLFSGGSSTVTLTAVNNGPFYVYNATVDSTADKFDSLSPLAVASIKNDSIYPHGNLTQKYVIIAKTDYGNHTASAITSSIIFGGTKFSLEAPGGYVSVYQPLNVTITTRPSAPEEGKHFHLDLTISNPTTVSVSDVLLTLPVPAGLTLTNLTNAVLSKGILTITTPSLAPHSSYEASSLAVASSATTLSFSNGNLTFVYVGVTVKGTAFTQEVTVAEDLTTTYLLPLAIAFIAMIATAIYVRRMATPTVQASPK